MRIGFVGLGHIGGAMATNLAQDGAELCVYDLDAKSMAAVETHGARACSSVADLARASDVVFLSLPTPDSVDTVAEEWLGAAPADAILVDLSTNAPDRVRALGERIQATGRHLLDAPLSGGAPGAQARMLMFMVGGEASVFERVRPVLEKLGRATFHLGPLGSGSIAKLVNSLVAFSTTMASLEALGLASKAGLDLRQMVTVLRTGGAGNFYTNMAVEGIERRSGDPQFALELAAKDADLFVALGRQVGIEGRVAALAADVLKQACERGMARDDWTNLPAFFESENDLRFRLAPEEAGD